MAKSEISRRTLCVALGTSAASATAVGLVLSRSASPSIPGRGRGTATSFGSVALLGSSRLVLSPAASSHGMGADAHGHGHIAGKPTGGLETPVPSAVHGAWVDAVLVDVEVHNGLPQPMELSPGQFRVRVADGPTVSLYSADREAGPLAPGSTTTLAISFLAPPPDQALSLEFADTGARSAVHLGRVGLTVLGGRA